MKTERERERGGGGEQSFMHDTEVFYDITAWNL